MQRESHAVFKAAGGNLIWCAAHGSVRRAVIVFLLKMQFFSKKKEPEERRAFKTPF